MPSSLRTTRTQTAPTTRHNLGNEVVPWPTRRGRNMPQHISRRLHPLHASQDARRPQGRVAAERRRRANEQNNKIFAQPARGSRDFFVTYFRNVT